MSAAVTPTITHMCSRKYDSGRVYALSKICWTHKLCKIGSYFLIDQFIVWLTKLTVALVDEIYRHSDYIADRLLIRLAKFPLFDAFFELIKNGVIFIVLLAT